MEDQSLLSLLHGPNTTHACILCAPGDSQKAGALRVALSSENFEIVVPTDAKEASEMVARAMRVLVLFTRGANGKILELSFTQAVREKIDSLTPKVAITLLDHDVTKYDIAGFQECLSITWSDSNRDLRHLCSLIKDDPLPPDTVIKLKSNIGAHFAYAHYYGYHKQILENWKERIAKSGMSNEARDPQKRNFMPQLMVVILESCEVQSSLVDMGADISHVGWLPCDVTTCGQIRRDYKSTVYEVKYEQTPGHKRALRFVADIPAVLNNLNCMLRDHPDWTEGVLDKTLAVQQFYFVLRSLVGSDPETKDKVIFVYIKDGKGQAESFQDLLKHEIHSSLMSWATGQQQEADNVDTATAVESPCQGRHKLRKVEHTKPVQYPSAPCYALEQKPVGIALIINIVTFIQPGPNGERLGADIDQESMEGIFQRLGFLPITYRDLTSSDIYACVDVYCQDGIHEDKDAFVLVLMSHGHRGKIIARDNVPVDIADLASKFGACQALEGKPKLGFVQACQIEQDQGHSNEPLDPSAADAIVTSLTVPTGDATPLTAITHAVLLPRYPDFLMSYACLPGSKAYRDEVFGSPYIQALKVTLEQYGLAEELEQILRRVSADVHEKIKKLWMLEPSRSQVPFAVSSLQKTLQFKL